MPDDSASNGLECNTCKVIAKEWYMVEIEDLSTLEIIESTMCKTCLDKISDAIGVDVTETGSAYFSVDDENTVKPVTKVWN
jgi:hypothetical protein